MKYFELQFTISPNDNQDARDVLSALLAEVGFETFEETPEGLNAYVQQQLWDEGATTSVVETFPMDVAISFTRREASYENWNEQWEAEGFEPIMIGQDICIHDTRHEAPSPTRYDILINPRMAFGSGTHPTTQMILSQLLTMKLEGKRVVDAGCGTGVLGILAMQRGAASVLAYDIDEWSSENAELNFALNGFQGIDIRLGDCSCIEGESGADLILANINRNILVADMPKWRKALAPGGQIVVSGFYEEDAPIIIERARELGLDELERHTNEGWTMLLLGAVGAND